MDKFFQNLTLGHLFRYGFSGFALLLVGSYLSPTQVTALRTALGDVLTAVVAFVVGGAIYAAYRAVVDAPLYWVHFIAHGLLMFFWRSNQCKWLQHTDTVNLADRLHAYRCIRDWSNHSEAIRGQFTRFELEHSEIHMLYLFAFVLAASSAAARYLLKPADQLTDAHFYGCLIATALVVFLGIIRDIGLCRRECAFLLGNVSEDTRVQILKDAKVIP